MGMKTACFCGAILAVFLVGSTALAQYQGDLFCSGCHGGHFDDYMQSGHPWKLFRSGGQTPDPNTWPHTPVPPLPVAFGNQLQWSDVEYVIGNFFWKARFIDRDGFIWTGDVGDATQWNLHTQEFVPYHPGEVKPYNCGRCHTTGYDPNGEPELPGLVGSWEQEGVRCEACHGPGGPHDGPGGEMDCADCHYRDEQFRMEWKGGFIRHHQQAEGLSHSPHKAFECHTCHNPHRSTVYGLGGSIVDCSGCHPGDEDNGYYKIHEMEDLECIDCHMPFMAKSAAAVNAYSADVRGHLFRIKTDPIFADQNVYEDGGKFFWNQDASGNSAATLDYACLGCHIDFDPDFTIEEAAAYAADIHNEHPANGGRCPCESVLSSSRAGLADLATLRIFRDDVMAKSSLGRQYTDLYYDHSREVVGILLRNPKLAGQSRAVLGQAMPKIEAVLEGRQATLSRSDIAAADWLLGKFAAQASPELKAAISLVRSDLKAGRLSSLFAEQQKPARSTAAANNGSRVTIRRVSR